MKHLSFLFTATLVSLLTFVRDTGFRAGIVNKEPTTETTWVNRATAKSPVAVDDVVTKALAFKAMLTATQQNTLQLTYTDALAKKWSNLPCGSQCRNGIQFSTLTADQLAAALAVIQAASGTVANEGYSEFLQIRAADDYLNANGGGSGYGGGIYFIAFLNTPSTTDSWMLQFGGHHYAANIAFAGGSVVGITPRFEGVEPTSFTVNGTAYAPLANEHDAMATMLASLSSTQLATAKLNQTFSDVLLSPGETNGGSGTFPTTKVGIAVNTLTTAQRTLVLAAMKPWVQDADDATAAALLAVYENELDNTYIAYTGNGTSGNAASFLNANTNYVRIDGPSVWIEFVCQSGVVFRNQIHYPSVWRDHSRDYGAEYCTGGMVTIKAGAWNDPTVWSCNRIPTSTDKVTVKHSVSLSSGFVASAKQVVLDTTGRLVYTADGRLVLYP